MANAAVEGVSGAAGGLIALLATYPLLTASTVQATRAEARGGTKAGRSTTLRELQEVVRLHGWAGLWAGVEASVVGTAASQGVYFYSYSVLRQAFVRRHERLTGKAGPAVVRFLMGQADKAPQVHDIGLGPSLLVAALAGALNVLITCPIWVVSTRAQVQAEARHRKNALTLSREVYEESGLQGFWKGVVPSLVMVVNPALQYSFYEWLLARYHRLGGVGVRRPGPLEVFALSALAKLGATVLSYPLLLVKSRLQAAGRGTAAERRYKGTLNAIFTIWRSEGPLGFYKGLRPKVVQSILAAALLMAVKEELATATARLLLGTALVRQSSSLAALGGKEA